MRSPIDRHSTRVWPFHGPAPVRALDAAAIRVLGPGGGDTLMQRAGESALTLLLQRWPACPLIQVVCGGGNNGGDGFVLARRARERGLAVMVWTLADPASLRGEARTAWEAAVSAEVPMQPWSPGCLRSQGVIVDALLGIGLTGAVREPFAAVIEAINAAGQPVLALDVPSGLCAATGASLGPTVQATLTVSFVALKTGLLTGEGVRCCGELWLDTLDVEALIEAEQVVGSPAGRVVGFQPLRENLPKRAVDAHKGYFGRVLVVGGDLGYGGAAILAAGSALRAGAGLVSCATRDGHVQPGLSCFPDVMFRAAESRQDLLDLLERVDVVALGPGLGRSPWGCMSLQTVLDSGKPLLLDADALNLLADRDWCNPQGVPVVLTPHPGEAARLLGVDAASINADRLSAATRLAERFHACCLLKGAGTVVVSCSAADRKEPVGRPGGKGDWPLTAVLRGGNPGMATAGMGDVLTGVIAGLLAQGLTPFQAATLGAAWHAASADACVRTVGEASLMASDVMQALGRTWVGAA